MLEEETLVVQCWSLLKLHYFSSSWPLEMSTTPRCPLLEIAAVCSYITGNSCQRQSQCLALSVRVWTPVQVVLFVLRTCLVLVEASWSQWTGGSLGFTERCMCAWTSHSNMACWIIAIHTLAQVKFQSYSYLLFLHFILSSPFLNKAAAGIWQKSSSFSFLHSSCSDSYRRFQSKSIFLFSQWIKRLHVMRKCTTLQRIIIQLQFLSALWTVSAHCFGFMVPTLLLIQSQHPHQCHFQLQITVSSTKL